MNSNIGTDNVKHCPLTLGDPCCYGLLFSAILVTVTIYRFHDTTRREAEVPTLNESELCGVNSLN
jgi:hypothetical protein